MKSAIIIFFIAISAVISSYYFSKRINAQTDEIDVIERSLYGTKTLIHSNSTINFAGQKDMVQLFSIARYVLAPALILRHTADSKDTLLTIQKNDVSDSTINTLEYNRQPIWRTSDSLYTYTLSVLR